MSARTDLVTLVDLWNIRAQALDDCPAPVQKLKNERGAGRKPALAFMDKQTLKDMREYGYSYREIAKLCGVSVGTVHKLINEHKKKSS